MLATGEPIALEQAEDQLVPKRLPESNPDEIAGVTVIKLVCDATPQQVLGPGYVVL